MNDTRGYVFPGEDPDRPVDELAGIIFLAGVNWLTQLRIVQNELHHLWIRLQYADKVTKDRLEQIMEELTILANGIYEFHMKATQTRE